MTGADSQDLTEPAAQSRSGAPQMDAAPFTFPTVARLELDQLLGQLIDRATEVLRTQGRLQGLVRATQAVATEL